MVNQETQAPSSAGGGASALINPRSTMDENRYQNLVVMVLAMATLLVTVFNRFRPKDWIPDSTITIFCGIAVGFLIGNPNETDLREEIFTTIFFDICMPPIAFAAALNESRTSLSGVMYAIASTTISAYLIGASIEKHFFTDSDTGGCLVKGCMVWGVVMAPVNARYVLTSHAETVIVQSGEESLTFEEEEEIQARVQHPLLPVHKMLDSWLHCEALLSGPVAVVFFTSLRQDRMRNLDLDPQETILNFLRVLVGSTLLGCCLGIFSSLTLRTPFEPTSRGGPYREVSLIVLWALASFFLARFLGLSAVGTLFSAGLVMKNTALRVVSREARHTARVGSEAIAATAEGFVLMYMSMASVGLILSLKYSDAADFHAPFIVLLACVFSRALISAFVTIVLGGGGFRSFAFIVTFLSGMRGAVSFSLALKAGLDNRDLLATSAIVAVFCHAVLAPTLALFVNAGKPKTRPTLHPLVRVYGGTGQNYDTITSRPNGNA